MKRYLALLLSGLLLLLSGCGAAVRQAEEEAGLNFYYSVASDTQSGSAIAPEQDASVESNVPDVMRRLLRGPESLELQRTFPEGTALLTWSLTDGGLTLNLSEAFGSLSGMALTCAEYCIVLTASQLEGVKTVTILVEGKILPGAVSGPLTAEDVVLKGETEDPFTVSSQLYFPLVDHSGLGVEYREFEVESMDLTAQANGVLRQLLQGPQEAEMEPFLNGTGLLEVTRVAGERCYVELDSATIVALCADESRFAVYLYALVDSLTELEGISSVTFQLDGAEIPGWAAEYTAVYQF